MRTFTKIGGDGQDLPADATEFVAVRDDNARLRMALATSERTAGSAPPALQEKE